MTVEWHPFVRKGVTRNYSISNKLKQEKKINNSFEIMLNAISLEDLIALKLELATKALGGKIYGFPLFSSLSYICKDALLKYAFSATKTRAEAARFIGLSPIRFGQMLQKFKIKEYFEKENEENENNS